MSTLAERLVEYQTKLGFRSVAAFAKAVNIPATTLHEVLKGRTKSLSAENAKKLADFMGITVDEVLGREKEKTPDAVAPREEKYNEIFNLLSALPEEKIAEAVRYLKYLAEN